MALLKTAVFVASRFDEFSELRAKLKNLISSYTVVQMTPIDLNDGNVSHRPPLTECLGYVRRSEFMILLLGETYGGLAPRSNKSFTHLEYEEAIKDGSGTRVLVFGIGPSYVKNGIKYSSDERLAAWQRQVEENHTIGRLNCDEAIDEIAKKIFDKLLAALYEMRFGALSVDSVDNDTVEIIDAIGDDSLLDDSEVAALEDKYSQGPALTDERNKFTNSITVLTQPAAVAALEQREEAQRALDIGEIGVAIKHLKRALEHRPLELVSNYWLSQLYVALGRKGKAIDAMELAERAARVAANEKLPYRAAASYMTAARAAQLADRNDEALNFSQQAVDIAPHFAKARIGLARQYAIRKDKQSALREIRLAFSLFPRSLREVFSDPIFRTMRRDIDSLVQELRSNITRDVADMHRIEAEISKYSGCMAPVVPLEGKTISQLIEAGRQSSRRQFEMVCSLISEAVKLENEVNAAPPRMPPVTAENMRFNRPGRARILEWACEPGDIVEPGGVIFSYQYEGSSRVSQWTFRGRCPVRITGRVDEAWVSDENPYLFEFVGVDVVVPGINRYQALQEKISATEQELKENEAEAIDADNNFNTYVQAKKEAEGDRVLPAGFFKIFVGLVGVMCAIYMAYTSDFVFSAAIFAGSLMFLGAGKSLRAAYRTQMEAYDVAIANAKQLCDDLSHKRKLYSQKLNLHQQELVSIEKASEQAKAVAGAVLELFECNTLRKSGKLIPFPSVYGSKVGDIVRISDRQLSKYNNENEKLIKIVESFPEGFASRDLSSVHLFRVKKESHEDIELSHLSAYINEETLR